MTMQHAVDNQGCSGDEGMREEHTLSTGACRSADELESVDLEKRGILSRRLELIWRSTA